MQLKEASIQLSKGTITTVLLLENATLLALGPQATGSGVPLIYAQPDLSKLPPAFNANALPKEVERQFVALREGDTVPRNCNYIGSVLGSDPESPTTNIGKCYWHVFMLSPSIPTLTDVVEPQ